MTDTDVACSHLHSLPNLSNVCHFVRNTSACDVDNGFINYTAFVYCTMNGIIAAATLIMTIWWLFVFCAMAMTANEFFCPSLAAISESLRLSHNVAGVTFLALGNGAADIFSSIAAVENAKAGDAGMAIGAIFGAAIAMTAVVVGTIVIVSPCRMVERPFLRDVVFSLFATYWTWYVLWDKKMTQYEAMGFIILYFVYVVVVILGRYIYQRSKSRGQPSAILNNVINIVNVIGDDSDDATQPLLAEYSPIADEDIEYEIQPATTSQPPDPRHMLSSFLYAINPVDRIAWGRSCLAGKIYECFKVPIRFILLLTVPIVSEKKICEDDDDDLEGEEDLRNWNKGLNSLHLLTGPLCISFLTQFGFKKVAGIVPVWALVVPVGVLLAVVVFKTSKPERRPAYHMLFAYLGFLVAVVWTYSFANEIVNVLQTIGIIFSISNAILGLTLLAWGNAMGDFITDFTMARKGYPLMGVSACFGGPLFNILLGLGIPFCIACVRRGGEFELKVNVEQMVSAGGMGASLLASFIVVPLCGFHMTRCYGIFLLILYALFLLVVVLTETNVIPNTDL